MNVVQRLWLALRMMGERIGTVMATAQKQLKKNAKNRQIEIEKYTKQYEEDWLKQEREIDKMILKESAWTEEIDLNLRRDTHQTKRTIHGASRPTEWYENHYNENMTPCPICSKRMAVLNKKGLCSACLLEEIKAYERIKK